MSQYTDRLIYECYDFIKDNCITKSVEPIVLNSSKISNTYFNIKSGIVEDPYFTNSICQIIDSKLIDNKIDYNTIIGIALGGVLISDRFIQFKHMNNRHQQDPEQNPDYIVCRPEERDHGIVDNVIGKPDTEEPKAVVIEDVVTSGNSVKKSIRNVKELYPNVKIVAVVTIVDRSLWFYQNDKLAISSLLKCKYLPIFRQGDFSEI